MRFLIIILAMDNSNLTKISNALKEHNIIRKDTPFLPFPLAKKDTHAGIEKPITYRVKIIDVEYKKNELEGIYLDELVSKYAVSVETDDREKLIGKFNPIRSLTGYVYVCGYFLSPFEDRAMAVIAEEHMAYEGIDVMYRFSGFHLEF